MDSNSNWEVSKPFKSGIKEKLDASIFQIVINRKVAKFGK